MWEEEETSCFYKDPFNAVKGFVEVNRQAHLWLALIQVESPNQVMG